ncbi:hypothetical protein SacN8_09520 [Sulfolobus acidocaldarius N8]|uniref:Uncharacterized protein n=2 Tax=Sulfolobus acidocaldarius TaxID=2285 RepID=M1IFG9_9CREN|nr:hypothetical protein SacN8_09520 [Sulfolobus acidocaldarius N8]AGE74133.1 hypothetical protein SacRon12I_09540 [Sulfolobus acidocaldarius Ron12/I]
MTLMDTPVLIEILRGRISVIGDSLSVIFTIYPVKSPAFTIPYV